jgi:hypothetical protein
MEKKNFEFLINITKFEFLDGIGKNILIEKLKIPQNEMKEEENKFLSFQFPFKKELMRFSMMGKIFMVMAKKKFDMGDENVRISFFLRNKKIQKT